MSPEEETVINRNTMKLQDHLYKALKQRDQYKAERDTLIDDIAVLRANNKRLERHNEALKYNENFLWRSSRDFEKENEALRLQADTYFDEWQTAKNLYNALTQHIRQKAEANPNVDRYIALVNYIDRLEKGES